jgi:hypothetical protein
VYIRNARGLLIVAGLVSATPVLAQQTGVTKADPTITVGAARKLALARVPGGKIQEEDLEQEKGRQVYSFEISSPGKSGVQEVLVDANDGQVLSVEPEDKEHQDKHDGKHDEPEERDRGKESGRQR